MNIPVDIICMATLRPELLEETLTTHVIHLFRERRYKCNFYIHIDLVGNYDISKNIQKIHDIIYSKLFGNVFICMSDKPHFGKAWMWGMRQAQSEYIFYLEEDWRMNVSIDFGEMLDIMEDDLSIAHLRLSAFKSETDTLKNWNKFLHWNGLFFEVSEEDKGAIGWAGHPGLTRTSFMKACLPYIDENVNPEKQIKHKIHPNITRVIDNCRFGSFHPQNCPAAVEDIGRKWMVENGYHKKGNKAWFTEWEKNDAS